MNAYSDYCIDYWDGAYVTLVHGNMIRHASLLDARTYLHTLMFAKDAS